MSQENVEVWRRLARSFLAGDWGGLGETLDLHVRSAAADGWPEPGPFDGREVVVEQFQRLAADFEEQRVSDIEVVATGEDWVVGTFRWDVRGAGSGLETSLDNAVAYRVKDGRMTQLHFRWTEAEALEAAGLRE